MFATSWARRGRRRCGCRFFSIVPDSLQAEIPLQAPSPREDQPRLIPGTAVIGPALGNAGRGLRPLLPDAAGQKSKAEEYSTENQAFLGQHGDRQLVARRPVTRYPHPLEAIPLPRRLDPHEPAVVRVARRIGPEVLVQSQTSPRLVLHGAQRRSRERSVQPVAVAARPSPCTCGQKGQRKCGDQSRKAESSHHLTPPIARTYRVRPLCTPPILFYVRLPSLCKPPIHCTDPTCTSPIHLYRPDVREDVRRGGKAVETLPRSRRRIGVWHSERPMCSIC
jgi:hypothetical protein